MANFSNADRVVNGIVTDLIGTGADDTFTISSTFLLGGTTSGLIDGGGGNDVLTLSFSNLTDVEIVGIEETVIATNSSTLEADQVANLGLLTLTQPANTTLTLTADSGDVADFAGLTVADGQELTVSNFLGTGVGLTVDFSGATFLGSGFIDYNGWSGDETVIGGTGDDQISGSSGDDSLQGGLGNDTLDGGSGDNTVRGDAGDDLITVSSSSGIVDGGADNDTIDINSTFQNSEVIGGAGTDTLLLSSVNLTGTTFSGIEQTLLDTSTSARSIDADEIVNLGLISLNGLTTAGFTLTGPSGGSADFSGLTLQDGERLNVANFFAANSELTTDFSGATFNGSSFIDYNGWSGDETVIGGSGDDDLNGSSGDDSIEGGLGNDTLDGGSGDNTLRGDAGDDLLIASSATGILDGGADNDIIDINSTFQNGTVIGGSGSDTVELTAANVAGTTFSGIEATQFVTSAGGRTIDAVQIANLGAISLSGISASTTTLTGLTGSTADFSNLTVADGQEFRVNNFLSTGTDLTVDFTGSVFVGSGFIDYDGFSGNETIIGGSGNDEISASSGDDSVEGGLGNDTLDGSSGNNIVRGDAGEDRLMVSTTSTGILDGGADNDVIDINSTFQNGVVIGGSGVDTIELTAANVSGTTFAGIEATQLVSSTGTRTIDADQVGNLGALSFSGINFATFSLTGPTGSSADFSGLTLGDGQELTVNNFLPSGNELTVDFSAATFIGSAFIDYNGFIADETVIGGTGDDEIFASSGDDSIEGGLGNDTLDGSSGTNTVRGNDGDDLLVVSSSSTGILDGGADNDIIDINTTFQNGVIIGGAGTDTVELAAANVSGTSFTGIEATQFVSSSSGRTIDADQIGNLGTITADLSLARLTLAGSGTVAADFSNLVLNDGQELQVSNFFATNDELTVDFSAASFSGSAFIDYNGFTGDETIIGGSGDDEIDASSGDDSIEGGLGDDTLNGSSNDNIVRGGAGNDLLVATSASTGILDGGADNDVIDINGTFSNSVVDGGTGSDTLELSNGTLTGTTFSGIETTVFTATSTITLDADQIINLGDMSYGANVSSKSISLTDANGAVADFNALTLDSGETLTINVSGTVSGNETTVDVSGPGFDLGATVRINGFSSDDTFIAGAAGETFNGSSGFDTVSYQESDAAVTIDLAAQTATGGTATGDTINSIEAVIGSEHDDLITTGDDDNTVDGGEGTDVMVFSGAASDYTIATVGAVTTVTDNRAIFNDDGVNTLTNVEILRFSDQDIVIGVVETPTISISATDADLAEGDAGATDFTFTLTRVGSTVGTSSVDYTVSGVPGAETAEAADFVGGAFPSGTVTFNDGEDSATLIIQVAGDTALESDENFLVSLSNPVNADILTAQADGEIQNDDVTSSDLSVTMFLRPGLGGSTQNAIAFDETADELFVLKSGSIISVISATDATLLRELTITGGSSSFDLQVVPSAFTLNGVDLPASTLLTVNNAGLIRAFDKADGAELASLTTGVSTNIVGGSFNPVTGTFFAVDDITNEIFELDMTTGATVSSFDIDDIFGEIINWGDVGVDPATGDLLVVGSSSANLLRISPTGDLLDAIPLPSGVSSLSGIAYADSDEVWVTETSGDIFKLGFFDAEVSILDISRSQSTRSEGDSGATAFTFTVSRTGDLSETVSVDFEVRPVGTIGTVEESDFVGGTFPTGTLTFVPNDTSETITINVQGDTVLEENELFEVVLINPVGAVVPVGPTAAARQSTISNDDASTTPTSVLFQQDGLPQLAAIAHDEGAGEVFVYESFNTEIDVYDEAGTLLRSIALPSETSNDIDLDVAPEDLTLNGVAVPEGSLLVINGETGTADIQAINPADGSVIATLTTAIGTGFVVGGAYDPNTDSFVLVDITPNDVVEISAADGSVLSRIDLSAIGRSTNFGDIDIDPVTGDIIHVSSTESTIARISRSGELLDEIPIPSSISSLSGVAVVNNREVYVSSTGGEYARIAFFDPATFPTAVDDVLVTDEDTTASVNLITGPGADSDPEGDTLTILDARDQFGTDIPLGTDDVIGGGGTIRVETNGDVTYDPTTTFQFLDDGESRSVFITYTVSDGNGGTDVGRLDITVNGENDAPVVAATQFRTISENSTNLGGVGGFDPDSEPLEWSISGGADAALFSINPSNGILSFIDAPDFEAPGDDDGDNVYEVEVSIFDGDETSVTSMTVNVVNVAEDPTISIGNVSLNEGDAGTTAFDFTIQLTETSATDITFNAVISPGDSDAADFAPGTVLNAPIPITIAAGDLQTVFTVNVLGDTLSEASETFNISLQDIVGAVEGDASALGVIINDDAANSVPTAVNDTVDTDEDMSVSGNVLDNDTDPNPGDTLSATQLSEPSNGTLDFNETTGAFTYTPDDDFNGTDSFAYQVSDGNGGTDSAVVTINVDPVNDAPIANDDAGAGFTTDEDTAFTTASVLDNDTDIDVDTTLSVSAHDFVTSGGSQVSLNLDGSFDITPTANANGDETFAYTVSDGNGGTDTAVVTITINPVNDDPVANDDGGAGFTTDEDTAFTTASVLGNDTDVDGDVLSVSAFDMTTSGGSAVSLNADGSFDITPLADANGSETFEYTVSDGNGGTDTATVTIIVNPVNDAPTANNDSGFVTDFNTALPIDPFDLLANDEDGDPDVTQVLSITDVGPAQNGIVELIDGQIVFTPTPGFTGTGQFTYTMSDGAGGSDTATVFVDVGDQPNRAPIAEDNATETDENNPVTFNILTNDTDPDGDPIEVNAVRDSGGNLIPFDTPTDLPEGGTITVSRDGTVTFDPDGDFEALGDNPAPEPAVEGLGLTYTVLEDTDEGLVSNSADITIGIRGVNDAPVARDDDFGTDEDTGISGNVLSDNGNSADSDVDADDTISVTAVNGVPASVGAQITLASGALLTLNADGTFDYDPNDGFESLGTGDTASDGFMYTLSDATGASSVASVTIAITGVNDAPVATDFDVTTDEDTPVTLAMDANVSDAEGDMLSFEFDVDPALGAVTFEDGAFVFTPTLNTNGPVEIGYTVTDEDDASDTGTIMVDVAAVNDAPVAVDDAFTVQQGTGVLFDLVANDTDVDGDTLSVLSVGVAANGLATANGYTPNEGFFGTDTFTYVVSDGNGGTDTGTVTITVTEEIIPNGPPVPGDVSVNLSEDDATDTIDLLAGATDPDEGDILSVVGAIASADDGRDLTGIVSISGSEVTVTPAGNFEALNVGESVEITISYSISDGTVSVPTTATLTVNGVNDAPVLDPAGPFDVAENTTAVATLTASDIDNTDLLYTVSGGADAAQFDINDDGELVFVSAPDFEDPDDVDDNNIYEVEVTVSDGDLTDSQVLSVTVTDVDDTDPVLNEVFGTNGSDRSVVGTDGDDIINSLAGRSDKITGLDGADIFDFSTSSDNGARETRRITDFDADEGDTLLLADGVSITRIRESRGDTQIYLDGDRDVIILEDVSGFGTDSLF